VRNAPCSLLFQIRSRLGRWFGSGFGIGVGFGFCLHRGSCFSPGTRLRLRSVPGFGFLNLLPIRRRSGHGIVLEGSDGSGVLREFDGAVIDQHPEERVLFNGFRGIDEKAQVMRGNAEEKIAATVVKLIVKAYHSYVALQVG